MLYFSMLLLSEEETCKVRYIGQHISEVKIDARPVNQDWVEFPVGARLEFLSNSPLGVSRSIRSPAVGK